ncbi:menaquinol-cytochrome c reductase cytochrome b subunit [mine drainage metagenome]|uniref:Menaquinol-cytochrome c reductase cytochrome b subunit n=1 Tax=mine drainage metagenome TaxID=410659 RepID=A0A1J5RJX5_9ZZZZ
MNSSDPSRSIGTLVCRRIDHVFDAVLGPVNNPWRHLGALGFLFLWLIVASGLYLYGVFDTSVIGAYRSVAWLSREQWYLGGMLRSLHRYAADAFVAVTLLHLLREFLLGRYSGFRRYSWLTGVPLLWFAYTAGIVGFWLGWDRLAQFSALAMAEWLDRLPLFAMPLTRNFLTNAAVSDRLFSLFVFVHIGVPLLLLFGLWFHVRRISRAEVFPKPALAACSLLALLVLALVHPVVSQGPADLSRVPGPLALDWFYLFLHPLMYAVSPGALWTLVAAVTLFLLALPALQRPAAPIAQVHPDACSGCRRCADDCPYAAIAMAPHPDRPGRELARVDSDLCASCGICAGSCPSSTPFRGDRTLVTGIDMPQLPLVQLRRSLDEQLAAMSGENRIVVFGCDCGARVDALAGSGLARLSLICAGMLPPSFVEYALRGGAAGVLVAGCRVGGCAFRLGNRWTEERLHGVREPRLRAGVGPDQLCLAWADRGEEGALARTLVEFRAALAAPLIRISTRD